LKNVIYFDFQHRRRGAPPVVVTGPFPEATTVEAGRSIHQLLALARSNPGLFLSQNRPSRFLSPALFRDAVWRANVLWQQPTPPHQGPPPLRAS
jgi:hypothetical protein